MAFDSVPWFVGGGAQHSPEIARTLPYALSSGAEGIVSAGDLKVATTGTPSTSVQVLPGGALARSHYNGGGQQTYVIRAPSATNVAIAAQGSTGTRYDMVIARVEDPFVPGSPYQAPTTVTSGPYAFPRVLSNVPQTAIANPIAAQDYIAAQGHTAVALAGITMGASTSTVTATMIKDLRALALPRNANELLSAQPPTQVLSSTTFVRWPTYNPLVTVPKWATWGSMTATVAGAGVTGNTDGAIRARFGGITGGNSIIDIDTAASREVLICTASGWIPDADKGRTIELVVEALRSGGSIGTNPGTQVVYDIRFYERTV